MMKEITMEKKNIKLTMGIFFFFINTKLKTEFKIT